MAATGAGTQTDPYIVDNWDDFLSVCNLTASTWIRWADADEKIIDFNEINPQGYDSTIEIKGNVDFNGWELRNLWSRANQAIKITGTSSVLGGIRNVRITNARHITIDANNSALLYISYANLDNISVSYEFNYISTGYAVWKSSYQGNLDRVGIYAYGMVTNGAWLILYSSNDNNTQQARNCRFHCEVQANTGVSRFGNDLIHIGLYNSVVSGEMIIDDENITQISVGHTTSALNVIRIQSNKTVRYGGNGISLKVDRNYSGDIVRPNTVTWDEHVLLVNTAQARTQQEDILAAGFPLHRAVDE